MSSHSRRVGTLEELVAKTISGAASVGRFMLGLAGTPGSGKSTLAKQLRRRLGYVPIVEMDGFHLSNSELEQAGLLHRKGALETFDGHGFVDLLRRIRNQQEGEDVTAPRFDRSREECVPDAIRIRPSDRIVIVEGNYLLSDDPPWASVRPNLDLCAFVDVDAATRMQRLVRRHMSYGRTRAEARRFVLNSDEHNAAVIEETRRNADLVVSVERQDVEST